MYTPLKYRRRRRYSINKRRFICTITCAIIILAFMFGLPSRIKESLRSYYKISDFEWEHLEVYFQIGEEHGVPWYYLAAVDRAEEVSQHDINPERSGRIALHLRGIEDPKQLDQFLAEYRDDKEFSKKVHHEVKKFEQLKIITQEKVFPIAQGFIYDYKNGFGDVRTFGGERQHEGIDIMCEKGVPIVSVCDGIIEKKGWLELGGWRLGIRGADGIYYYYAHFSRYNGNLAEGSRVKKGQVVGYAGDSGYGGEGTTGKFAPHLHFGMYEGKEETAVNPYPFLKAWEKSRVQPEN
jgi:murein DD-endopeptidase MepM/ murein hydrolase activator NlpD